MSARASKIIFRRRAAAWLVSLLSAVALGADTAPPGAAPAPAPDSAPKLADQPAQVIGDEITPAQEKAVTRGLQYLAGRAGNDGSFGGMGVGYAAVPALSGLAFMSAGNLPGRGKYGPTVSHVLDYLLHCQQESGFFSVNPTSGEMYSHGFATLFVSEVYGMTGNDEIKENLQRAVRLIERCQNDAGGWRYQPAPVDADLSVTICQIMALRAARDAGIHVEATVMDKAINYVRKCQTNDGGFCYQAEANGGSTMPLTAAGTAALYYAGIFQDNAVTHGLDHLMHFLPTPGAGDTNANGNFFYGNYYAVQATFLAGGKYWSTWYPGIRDTLIQRQNGDGSWSGEVSPEYCTAMALIILQMPNRYLPVFNGKGPGS